MFQEMKAINQDNKEAQYQRDKSYYMYGKDCFNKELSLEDSVKDITNDRDLDNTMRGWHSENF